RDRPLGFRFDGLDLSGYAGDTLASALLANGVRVVARSFKYHRPRGIFSAGEEEPCALVEIGSGAARVPNCRAPVVPLRDGLVARSQQGWPSVNFDVGRLLDYTHPLWPAGFYNKTFKWPHWHAWEGFIRRAAGLGRPLTAPDPDRYEQVNAHCDLLICGGGPAGLVAALAAGRAGLRVILADQGEVFGGGLNAERIRLDERPATAWVAQVVAELDSLPGVILLPRTVVTAHYDHQVTALLQTGRETAWRECLWTVRPRQILLATGAIEQGLIFPNNDRPGVMLAGAVRHYLNRFAVIPGRRITLTTNNDIAYQTVFDLAAERIPVVAVIDCREQVDDAICRRLDELDIELLTGARIIDTRGTRGLREVSIESLDGSALGRRRCDLLAVSGGWSPRLQLLAQARGDLVFDATSQSFLPGRLPPGFAVAGAARGTPGLAETLGESLRAAQKLCSEFGRAAPAIDLPRVTETGVETLRSGPLRVGPAKRRQWIDLAHDVTFGDAELAVREGYVSVEHFKRYTTTGMSVDQGKTGNLNAFTVLGALTGRALSEVGTTTFRPPYLPVTLGAIAGRTTGEFHAPRRYLPAHTVHRETGARFGDYGWQRPDAYPRAGESLQQAIHREARAVRQHVGIFDNSPIGKIELRGPDAAEFLNRVYMNKVPTLQTGRIRYGLMLNENGVIIDDGVFARLGEQHFLINTTSAGIGRIVAMMEHWLQCQWPDLRVLVDDVTEQWANFTIAGPKSRALLTTLGTDIELAKTALPHMSIAAGTVAGTAARIMRVSFSGEMSFEINVPARQAASFLRAVLAAGQAFGITPYGVEALMILRLEKGYLHIGSDTDGSSTPDDVGWGRVARNKTSDYIGRRSLFRASSPSAERRQLVGLEALTADQALRPGAHLLLGETPQPPAKTDGWITSAAYSPNLGRHIALGVLTRGREHMGEVLTAFDEEQRYRLRVTETVFYDVENKRLRD
ncbi:MAG: sarcosine oxidase subunit alpha family protein, partial [Xanthomonadales bacterium]|nr:sarcosine oxidase subunit alpha family protein [Xanthomonadales bacterium]